jgi:hypothetical protein
MPNFLRDAYAGYECYGGTTKKDLEGNEPPKPQTFLRPVEITAVTEYILVHVKGQGEPTLQQCIEFFGEGSRVCNALKQESKPAPGSAEGNAH